MGSPVLLTAGRFAALVTRDGQDWFVGKGESRAAAGAEASAARRLYRDLANWLSPH